MRILLNHSQIHFLHNRFPSQTGVLFSPQKPRFLKGRYPYAIDNGAFAYWKNKQPFDSALFLKTLEQAQQFSKPEFVVCPDEIGDHRATLRNYSQWAPIIKEQGFNAAFVAQDGCSVGDVPSDCDWVFIGGSTEYKDWAIGAFSGYFKPVHCGRVNYFARLWRCHNNGMTSVDGSGWFRGDQKQSNILIEYLEIASGLKSKPKDCLFNVGEYLL